MNITLIATMCVVQMPLMVAAPLLIGWWLRRRYGVSWRIYLAGGLTFIASQVVHLPLNWALGLLGGTQGVGVWPLPLMALVGGLTAGVCEEGARWLVLRLSLRKTRGWQQALQFGAGHGGFESIIFGLLALTTVVSMIALQQSGVQAWGLSGDAAEQATAGLAAFWNAPWYTPVIAGLERLFAIAFHIAMSVLVMRAVMRRQPGYLAVAVLAHTALDWWAIWGMNQLNLLWTEMGVGLMAAGSLWLIVRLREAQPEQVSET
jgi:uncharacterized membrane protein YhfC